MRVIDVDALIEAILEARRSETDTVPKLIAFIGKQPSAEPKAGKWEDREVFDYASDIVEEWQSARCSHCNKYLTTPYMYYFENYKFCPNCGADMRGGQE